MSKRPAPLVPAECSMAGNDWFPLYFQRLRKSKWWRRASDMARARNVMLWGDAYQATPAGSLPDDDDDLAEAAGFGMDVDAFVAAKAEIMAPWVLCSDGRWYHPTTCEMVLDAWGKLGERRRKDAQRKADQRARTRGDPGDTPPSPQCVPRDNEDVPRDSATVQPESAAISAQREQTGEERQKKEDANASLSSADDELTPDEYPEAFEICWKAYPHIKGRSSKRKTFGYWRRLTPARRSALPSAIARYAREGREPKEDCGAPAMERWLRDERYLDWIDGPGSAAPVVVFAGPSDLRAAVVAAKGEGFAIDYLDRCGWRDLPERALLAPLNFSASKLNKEIATILRDFEVHVLVEPVGRTAA